MDQGKRDRTMAVVFNQLEMLQEMAVRIGDPELANDLSAAFSGTLARYCDHKRTELGTRLSQAPAIVDSVRQTRRRAQRAMA